MMKTHRKQNAFTVVEALMALVILAILMAAVAVTFDASVKSYHVNQGIYKTVNTGRQALLRITNQIRTAGGLEISGTYYPAVALTGSGSLDDPDNTQLSLTSDGVGLKYTYRYDNTDNTLYLVDNADGAEYVLCDNITDMSFVRDTCTVEVNGTEYDDVRSVRIVMTLTDDLGKVQQTLATASVVRKNL